eukprot:gene43416-53076_t
MPSASILRLSVWLLFLGLVLSKDVQVNSSKVIVSEDQRIAASSFSPSFRLPSEEVQVLYDLSIALHFHASRIKDIYIRPSDWDFNPFLFPDLYTSDSSPCLWVGVYCQCVNIGAGFTCNVLGIQLWGIGLSGSMERIAFDRLRRLQLIDFGYNDIGGRIPDIRWSEMSVFNRLDLKYNRFTGTIPSALGRLSNLDILALQGNRFTGTIPPSLGDAQALSIMTLFDNDLKGTIPASLGNLHDLRVLCLQDNQLVGSIPSSLSKLDNLRELSLH